MEFAMDNKYGLGSSKVATQHHHLHHKVAAENVPHCKVCNSIHLVLSPSMHDHCCADCGAWQHDVPAGYSTGRSSDY